MLKFRTGLVLAALLLCACDHHKKVNQAQAEAGTASVGRNDSELTGEPPATNAPSSTNTQVAANASVAPASVATPPSPDTNAPASTPQSMQPPADTSSSSSATPPPTDTTSTATSQPAASSTTDSNSVATSSPTTPPAADTTAAAPPPSATPPATDATTPATSSPATDSTPTATSPPAAPSSNSGTDEPRLSLNTPNPVAASTPSTAPAEEEVVVIDTSLGRIVIETDDSAAPKTSENFHKLATDGFYNHTIFHRVIPHFIIQGGDPNSLSEDRSLQGKGGPGYTLPPEIKLKHDRGAVAMARLPDSVNPGRESNGSQFYICLVDSPSLDDQYTVFGHVIKGMEVVEAIANQPCDKRDNPINRIEMEVTVEQKEQALSEGSTASP